MSPSRKLSAATQSPSNTPTMSGLTMSISPRTGTTTKTTMTVFLTSPTPATSSQSRTHISMITGRPHSLATPTTTAPKTKATCASRTIIITGRIAIPVARLYALELATFLIIIMRTCPMASTLAKVPSCLFRTMFSPEARRLCIALILDMLFKTETTLVGLLLMRHRAHCRACLIKSLNSLQLAPSRPLLLAQRVTHCLSSYASRRGELESNVKDWGSMCIYFASCTCLLHRPWRKFIKLDMTK